MDIQQGPYDPNIAGTSDGAILDGISSSIKATVINYSNSNPLTVRLTDTNGDYVVAGGGVQYAVDDVGGGTDTGTLSLVVRDDSLTTLTPADGDYTTLRVNSTGALYVTGAGGGTQYNIDTALGATDTTTLAGVVRDDSLTTLTEADGDVSVLRVSSTGALHVTGGGGGTEYTEDVTTANPIVGAATLIERDDALSTVTPVEGDWIGLRGSAEGALWTQDFNSDALLTDTNTIAGAVSGTEMQVDVVASLPAGTNLIGKFSIDQVTANANEVITKTGSVTKLETNSGIDIGDVDILSVIPGTGATNLGKAEDAVHTTGDVGVMPLAVRNDTLSSLVDTDGDYAPIQVSDMGAVYTTGQNLISTNNSTTSTLAGGVVYTGTGDDLTNYSTVTIQLDSSHNSATDGMTFQFSTDNTNWDDIYIFTYTAADGSRRFQFPVTAQYFRIVYTNGATIQTSFRVQTILHTSNQLTSVHRLGDDENPDRSSQLMKTAIIAQAAGSGDFVPVQATGGGNLKVSVQEFSDGVDVGNGTVGSETLRVTLASDTTGVLSVDDNGGTLTVDNAGLTELAAAINSSQMDVNIAASAVTLIVDGSAVTQPVSGTFWQATQPISGTVTANAGTGTFTVDLGTNNDIQGQVAHDAVSSGNPVHTGAETIAHGTNPTAVAAGDISKVYSNRAGIPFVIGGHPNIVTIRANYTAAQTDTAIITIATGLKIVVTRCSVTADNANTVDVQARIGFATTTTPTTTGVIMSHPGIAAGSGVVEGNGSGILGVGADNEDLRITSEVPTTGSIDVVISYYTIES